MRAHSRIREIIGRRGVRGTLLAGGRLLPWTRWHDEFLFLELDLTDPARPRRPFDGDLQLRRGGPSDLGLLAQLPHDPEVTTITPELAAWRLEAGVVSWLVTEGDVLAFACWNYLDRGPLVGAQGGQHPIPSGVVLLEDSISAPGFRGRGVAPAAWSAIADHHADQGHTAMITKVRPDNPGVRRALEKVGFREVALMRRSGPAYRMRLTVAGPAGTATGHWLTLLAER